jgi:hypothetical protein
MCIGGGEGGGGEGGGMSSGMASLISAGVDDLMQTTEFWTNTYVNNLSKEAKDKKRTERRRMNAESGLIEEQANILEDKRKRQRKIRNIMMFGA